MSNNYRRGENYDQFIARQAAEAAGKAVPPPALPSLLGDPSKHMHISDAVKLILNPPAKRPARRV
jgi:hypothetical protein